MNKAIIRQVGSAVQLIIEGKPKKMASIHDAFDYAKQRSIQITNPESLSEYFQEEFYSRFPKGSEAK